MMVDIGLGWDGVLGVGWMPIQPVLAQVNLGGTWSTLLGIALACSGLGLYALRSFRPKLARDHDIFFSAVALLCGGILFFQGWRQDPILQFGQFLLTGSVIFFAVESIRLRGIATEQARRNAPVVDEDRPVSPVYEYRAEIDDFDAFDDQSVRRPRIRGSRDVRPGRDEYEEDFRRYPASRSGSDDRLSASDRSRRRQSSADDSMNAPEFYADEMDRSDRQLRSRNPPPPPRTSRREPPSDPPRRSRSLDDPSRPARRDRRFESASSEYVDYRPVDPSDKGSWGEY